MAMSTQSPILRTQSSQSSLSSCYSNVSSSSAKSPSSGPAADPPSASTMATPLTISRPTTPIMTPPPSSCSPPSPRRQQLSQRCSSPLLSTRATDDNNVPHPAPFHIQRPATPPTDSSSRSGASGASSSIYPIGRPLESSSSHYLDSHRDPILSAVTSANSPSSYLITVPRTPVRHMTTPQSDRFITSRPKNNMSAARMRAEMMLPPPLSPSNTSAPPEYYRDPIHDPNGHWSRMMFTQMFGSAPTECATPTSSSASRRLPFTLSTSDRATSSASGHDYPPPTVSTAFGTRSSSPTRSESSSTLASSPLSRRSSTLATATRRARPAHSRTSSRGDDPLLRSPIAKRVHLDLAALVDDNKDPRAPHLLGGAGTGAKPRTPSTPSRRPRLMSLTSSNPNLHYLGGATPVEVAGRPHAGVLEPETLAAIRAQTAAVAAVRRRAEAIPDTCYKILDAPGIVDDFYLNVLDWSYRNVIAVGLGSAVYMWDAATSAVTLLTDLAPLDSVASVKWNGNGKYLAVGTSKGLVQLWDVEKKVMVREFGQGHHDQRVGVLCWSRDRLLSGSKDHRIFEWDHRAPGTPALSLNDHRGEVTAIQWAVDNQYLASGGNDNRLLVWDPRRVGLLRNSSTAASNTSPGSRASNGPLYTMTDHTAAVRAVAWSPHNPGVLASGGGTNDKTIRLWNLRSSQPTRAFQMANVGSQVCTLAWSRTTPGELVSTHGFNGNAIVVWDSRNLAPLATLSGHSSRVLYMSMSPDGTSIVTGSGDESLRLWKLFPPAPGAAVATGHRNASAAAGQEPVVKRYPAGSSMMASRVFAAQR
ncbi:WD40-repeat-containing domain protein [Catenaria anguillulae PL171]|uniref:WD40-repeat-containing domain protein n=1 Tax=Catenaria anguillulae PL171 TaxID=765915 RepID=A0A1Y2I390_9FUNG|nr:WD40-repeat-containing domain protein [Catenaria anguillulae PL171]